jgi:opacity protein-like surface antigen
MNPRPLAVSLLALSAAALAATPAAAQSGRTSWTGPYVGGQIGVGNIDNDRPVVRFDTNRDGSFGDTVRTGAGADAFSTGFCDGKALGATRAAGCDNSDAGIEGGVHAGFDLDLGSFVVGLVGEYDRHNLEDDVTAFSTTPASYSLIREIRSSYGLRARAGVPLSSNALIYGTAGIARGQFRHRFETTNTANSFAVTDTRTNAYGFRAGGGLEQRFGPISVGALYLYSSFKDKDDSLIDVTRGTAPATNPFVLVNPNGTLFQRSDEKFRSHSVKLTGSVRF